MPDWKRVVARCLAPLGLEPAREAEIVEELAQHLDDRYNDLCAGGASDSEATRGALSELDESDGLARALLREVPNMDRIDDASPMVPGLRSESIRDAVSHDVRYAVRMFRKNPGFTAVVVMTLALGVGATTAIFSLVDGVMLRPLPYPESDRIMILSEMVRAGGQGMSISWPNFQDWRDQNRVFEHFGAYRGVVVNLTGGDRPERLNGSVASCGVFKALGVPPLLGRAFLPEEDRAGSDRVAIISERLWRSRFSQEPGLVGRALNLNGQAHTIVGVMPAATRFPSRLTDVWLPLGLFVNTFPADRGAHPGLTAIGKLKPGVTFDQASANMDTVARQLEQHYPESNRDHAVAMTPYYEQIVRNIRPALFTLVGAVSFVLLIGCANLANLTLAKADGRQREIAVRAALGADRRRIVQQLLTESVLLALTGGALGALLAAWAVKAFVAQRPASIPRIDLVAVDLRVLVFTGIVAVGTGIIFGLAPALRASRADLLTPLKEAVRASSSLAAGRVRSFLVIAEVGLALVLLIGAGLMIRSFSRLTAIDPGFRPDHVVTMRVTLPEAEYPNPVRWTAFHQELMRRVAGLPAVDAAGLNSAVPLEGGGSESPVIAEGQPLPGHNRDDTMCLFQISSPDYFRAMGIDVLKGRPFTDTDTADSVPVAVVDETLARRLFPNVDPIGRRIAFEFRGHSTTEPKPIWREVVGVVRHVHHYGMTGEPPFVQVYAPLLQLPLWYQERRPSMALVARTALEPQLLTTAIREQVAAIDRNIPVYGIQTMNDYLAQNIEQPRMNVFLLGSFGALALVLAMIGIYGVLSYSVTERTREIGVRMALGATRGDVLRLVVGRGMTLATIGIVLGLGASWGLARYLRSLIFEISPHDPATLVSIVALLTLVACVASYLPGRRATRVDPLLALRYE
jgi:putative ABC transport system permease protein